MLNPSIDHLSPTTLATQSPQVKGPPPSSQGGLQTTRNICNAACAPRPGEIQEDGVVYHAVCQSQEGCTLVWGYRGMGMVVVVRIWSDGRLCAASESAGGFAGGGEGG